MNEELCQFISTDEVAGNDIALINWLQQKSSEYKLNYLLAHAEDGVIWGRFDKNYKLRTADLVFNKNNFDIDLPKLRLRTLQQCRIFGDNGEILLWKHHEKWQARLIQDDPTIENTQEEQILWGTQIEKSETGENGEQDGFTLLSDGSQGLKHAVPLTELSSYFNSDKKKLYRPVRLVVNHYIKYDKFTGVAKIVLSRLVSLKKVNSGVK
jgi:CRISPR-associated protein (TIGR03984 family)